MRSLYYPRSATRGRVRMSEEYMDEINVRILRVTEDLRAIQQELNCAAMEAPSNPELMESLSRIAETESLQVLQSAIDQMRHFLWFYGQILTGEPAVTEHLRLRSQGQRSQVMPPVAEQRLTSSEKTAWPSETTLIRMLADGRNRKPN
jgi:hypothetical protein